MKLLGKGLTHKLEHVGLVEIGVCREESQMTEREAQNRNLQRPHKTRRPKQGAIAAQRDDEVNALQARLGIVAEARGPHDIDELVVEPGLKF